MKANNNETGSQDSLSGAHVNINGRNLPVQVFIFCLVTEVLLVLLDAFVNYAEWSEHELIRNLFDTTVELSLASWFMVTQTFVASLVLWVIFLVKRDQAQNRARLVGWGFLASFFTYLSVDDGAVIHERIGVIVQEAYGAGKNINPEGLIAQIQALFPSYDWQWVVLPFLVGAGVFMLLFLWRELHTHKERLLLFAAAGCMGLAVGLDFIEGLGVRHPWNLGIWFAGKFDIHVQTATHYFMSLEEFLEMLAMSLLLALFLSHLIRISGTGLTFYFQKQSADKTS